MAKKESIGSPQRWKPTKQTKSERTKPKNKKRKPYRGQGRV